MKKKLIKTEIINLCENFAFESLGQRVRVYGSNEFSFECSGPCFGEEEEITPEIWVSYKEQPEELFGNHAKIEKEFYGETLEGLDPFTIAFLHEMGHIATLRWFSKDLLFGGLDEFQMGTKDLEGYKLLPHEMMADLWSIKMFTPMNKNKVKKFNKRITKLLRKLRNKDGK